MRVAPNALTALVLLLCCIMVLALCPKEVAALPGPDADAQSLSVSSHAPRQSQLSPWRPTSYKMSQANQTDQAANAELRQLAKRISALKKSGAYDEALWDQYFGVLNSNRVQVSHEIDQGGDDCANATVIGALPYVDSGTTVGASDDYDYSGSLSCPWASTSPDVVYQYAPAANEVVDISLCNSQYDTKLMVFEDVCGPPNILACDDDGCGYYVGYTSKISDLNLYFGHTYYIVVDGYGGDAGEYTIDISYSPIRPTNDDCEDAILISCDTTGVYADLTGATLECTNIDEFPEVWYRFNLDPTVSATWDIAINYCDSDPNMTLVSANIQNDCDCNDAFGWTDVSGTMCPAIPWLPEWIYLEGVPAGEWYLPIYNNIGTHVVFDLVCVPAVVDSCPIAPCFGTPELPNDGGCLESPNEAQPITCGEVICGTATAIGGIRDTDWFTIATAEPSILTWDVWFEYPLDMRIGVYDAACGELYSAQDSLCGETIVTDCLPPGLYYLYAAHQNFTGVPLPTNYRAKLSCAPCLPNPCPNQEIEPNDVFPPAQSINLGEQFCGVIQSVYDQDKVELILPYRTAIEITMLGDGIVHPCVEILSEINQPIGLAGDSTNTITQFSTDFKLAQGSYVLNVMGAAQTTGRYQVTVNPIALPTVAPPDPVVTLQRVGSGVEVMWYQSFFADEQLRIERADSLNGAWTELATIPGNQPSYLDTDPPDNHAFYRVIASGEREVNPYIGTTISLDEPDGQGGYLDYMDFEIQEMEFAADSLNRIVISWFRAQGVPPNDDYVIDNDIRFQYGQELTPIKDFAGHILSVYGREMLIDHISFAQDSLGELHIVEARGRDPKTDSLMTFSGYAQYLHPSGVRQGAGWWSGYPGFWSWLCNQHLCCELKSVVICNGPVWAQFPCPPPNSACVIQADPNPNAWKVWCICPGQPMPPPRNQMFCTFKLYVKCKSYPCPNLFPPCYCPVGSNCPWPQHWTPATNAMRHWLKPLCEVKCEYPSWWRWGWRWWFWWWYWWHEY
jgi:hypothetical protein